MTGLTSMVVHNNADMFAVGSAQQFIGVLNEKGEVLGTIKYHDGFMGQRIGPISCMTFHPYKVRGCIFMFTREVKRYLIC